MGVMVQFNSPDKDGNTITIMEERAKYIGYKIGKYGEMTVVLTDEADTLVSVHTGVRSAWANVSAPAEKPAPESTTAIDISSLPKKKK